MTLAVLLSLGYFFRYQLVLPASVIHEIENDLLNHLPFRSPGPLEPSRLFDRWFGYTEIFYEIVDVTHVDQQSLPMLFQDHRSEKSTCIHVKIFYNQTDDVLSVIEQISGDIRQDFVYIAQKIDGKWSVQLLDTALDCND
jgi:hypothetical protein